MRRTRVIPVLLIHKGGVYKTTKFSKPVYIGDPINAIRLFNDMEVDEIAILDIDASKEGRVPNFDLIKELTSEAFMPFAYGGGITSIDQVRAILQYGVEKVVINRAFYTDESFVARCAEDIGRQSIVVSIDCKKKLLGGKGVFDHVSGKYMNLDLGKVLVDAEKAGAGEILINSVDRDGTMAGIDHDLVSMAAKSVTIPIIACGGAGSLEDLKMAEQQGASAIAVGSMFVYKGKQRGVLINYPTENQLRTYLK
jgi:imidazole glycerol-phosphate synthase subunit HisF